MDTFNTVMTGCRIGVVSIGLIGHVLTFIIFSRPAFQKNSISTYCRALAISECFIVYELVFDVGIAFFSFIYPYYSDAGCRLYYYISFAFGSIPGWILIAFSIDKVLCMKKIGAKFINKRWFQCAVIVGIVLFNLILFIEVPIYISLVQFTYKSVTYSSCDTSSSTLGDFVTFLYLIDGSVLPFVIMLIASIIMIKMIRQSSRRFSTRRASHLSKRTSRDIKFAITSVAMNVLFVLFKLPLVLMLVLSRYYSNLNAKASVVAFLLYFTNYSISFFVHLVFNSIFRREFLIMLRIRSPNSVHSLGQSVGQSTLATNRQTANKMPSVH